MPEGRLVRLVYRADNRQVIEANRQTAASSDKLAETMSRNARCTTAAMRATGSALESVGRTMTNVGVGMIAAGYAGVKSAIAFSTQMERIHTQAGATQREVNKMTAAINAYVAAGKSTATTTELAQGLFFIESVGIRGPRAMKALSLSEQAAAISGANSTDVSSAFASAITASHTPVSQYQNLMAQLSATVAAGKLNFRGLTDALVVDQQGALVPIR
jgi:hypothetical protein